MGNEVTQEISSCEACQRLLPSQPHEPMKEESVGNHPMEQVGADLFQFQGEDWLVMVDRYSGYPWTRKLHKTDTKAVLAALRSWFSDTGLPGTIRTDGGPQFRGEFDAYCGARGIKHETSSPYNPSSNGLAEAGVKNMKRLIAKCRETREDFQEALLEWRNTPNSTGYSPAEAFFGRAQRTTLPALPRPPIDQAAFQTARQAQKDERKARFDESAHALPDLVLGQKVRVQDNVTGTWTGHGTIVGECESGRTFQVKMNDGSVTRRNRRLLRPAGPPTEEGQPETTAEREQTQAHNTEKDPEAHTTPTTPRRSSRLASKPRVSFAPTPRSKSPDTA